MNTLTKARAARRRRVRHGATVLALGIAAGTTGCDTLDQLIDVEAPSQIEADVLETPDNASRLLVGAIGDFECAFGQYVTFMGTYTDELEAAQGSEAWRPIDARNLTTAGFDAPHAVSTCDGLHQGNVPGVYKTLSTARWQADHLLELLDEWGGEVADAASIRSQAAAYSGYSHLLLGESMCTAAFDLGPELQPAQIFERAIARFTTALEGASAEIRDLALVGRARTHLNLGDLAAARQDAEQVSAGFRFDAEFSDISFRRENMVYRANRRFEYVTVGPEFRDLADPRVVVEETDRIGRLTGLPIWLQHKYETASDPIRLASWAEAQLIIAEAALEAGQLQTAVDALNRVRTRAGVGLAPLPSGTAAQVRQWLLDERKAELFLESQRQSDLRRLNLPLVPAAGTPYPAGGTYADNRCLPLPLSERTNNPNI